LHQVLCALDESTDASAEQEHAWHPTPIFRPIQRSGPAAYAHRNQPPIPGRDPSAGTPIAGGEAVEPPHAHTLAEVAHDIEEEVEGKAAIGFLGGPIVWGLLVILALALIYFVAS